MRKCHAITTIVLFGSLWGFFEATIGGVLHMARVPYTGTIMASLGFAILFAALRQGVGPVRLFAVSLIAASFKFLDPILFKVPWLDMTVVNPAVAITSQGLAFAIFFSHSGVSTRIASVAPRIFGAVALSMIVFNVFSLLALGWTTNHIKNPWNTVFVQLPLMTIGATALARAIVALADRVHISISPRWQAAAAATCIVFTVIVRTYQ